MLGFELNEHGKTELSQACLDNDVDKVKELLKKLPSRAMRLNWNNTMALRIAALYSKLAIVKLILKATLAEYYNSKNDHDQSPYDYTENRSDSCEEKQAILKLFRRHGMISTDCKQLYHNPAS